MAASVVAAARGRRLCRYERGPPQNAARRISVNISAPFIRRPVATTLLTMGLTIAGIFAFTRLQVSPLPQVDFATIEVQATMAGASPETMASSVAAPLERRLGIIAGVTEMTSESSTGSTQITLQFGLSRDINGAARDVQAAINAARADLPTTLRQNPTYRKYNPADAPLMVIALTSDRLTAGQLYDIANNVVAQKLSQLQGIGNVLLGGSSLPAVRVDLDPGQLAHYGIGLEDVRAALASANANSPKGAIEQNGAHFQLYANDQGTQAADYRGLIIAYRNGAGVRLSDVADVTDSVEDLRNLGLANGKPAVLMIVFGQPDANIINTVAGIRATLPQLLAALPSDVHLTVGDDHSTVIRASLHDTEATLLLAVLLVVGVVFVFLRSPRAALIPAGAVPVSIIGTFGAMYLCGYTLDNLSLMALTISTGFVVDDAIVVLENIMRHIEAGMAPREAALRGAGEVAFTVLSMSVSLIAVFLPILLMGGVVGRLFREFAVTLSLAIMVSLVLSLTTTPLMCALLLRSTGAHRPGAMARWFEEWFASLHHTYAVSLAWSLRHRRLVIVTLACTVALNVWLFSHVQKGFFPEQDSDLLMGGVTGDETISFQAMRDKLVAAQAILGADPAVLSVMGFTGGRGTNSARVFVQLKPKSQRASDAQILARLRPRLARIPGARTFLFPHQDLHIGGRLSFAQYQYTLQADDSTELAQWSPRLLAALKRAPALADLSSDDEPGGLTTQLHIDRDAAARYGLTPQTIDATLYDAFGQRQVSTIYEALNQYKVIMEIAPRYLQSPASLKDIYISTSGQAASGTQTSNASAGTVQGGGQTSGSGTQTSARNAATNAIASAKAGAASAGAAVTTNAETMVPLSAVAALGYGNEPTSVNHQGSFVATTISFNLNPGYTVADAVAAVSAAESSIRMPVSVHGAFAGSIGTLQSSLSDEPLLIVAALGAVYIVLGVLYESFIHPITILSTLPSAGVGAVLALLISDTEFSVIALIGVILLIGIVKKNAILMVDFALEVERAEKLPPEEAIYRACLLRFRPILMTTCAALLGALPLILANGEGSELRAPLGLSIVGGLIVSQVLTLYTTPVVYLYLDQFRVWSARHWRSALFGGALPEPGQ
jgi:multidrug efflux pump